MSDVYRVAVSLVLSSNHGNVLGALSGALFGVEKQIAKMEGGFNRLKLAAGGAMSVIAGVGILAGLKKIASHGEELLDQQDKLIRAGRSHADVVRLTADAYSTIAKSVPTAAAADILRTTNQLAAVVGDLGTAEKWAPFALKTEALIANATGASADGSGHAILRALEMRGLTAGTDAQKAIGQQLAAGMVQDITASGGKLTARDFATMAKRGGAFYSRLSPEFISGAGAVLAADMGGETAGTTLATTGMFFTGAGTMSKQQFEALRSAGMIDMSKVAVDKGGRVNAKAGAILGSDMAMSDPFQWVQKVLLPHLHGEGLKDGSTEMGAALSKIGRNRNTMRELTMFSSPEFVAQIQKDIQLFRQALGIDKAYDSFVKNDPKGVRAAFDKQYDSMMQAVGAPLMQAALPVMRGVTSMFESIGELANRHGDAIKVIGAGFAGLGAALVGGGATAIFLALGPAGWLIGGLTALGAAAAAYKPGAVAEMAKGIATAWDGLLHLDFHKTISGIGLELKGALDLLPGEVRDTITRLAAEIGSWPGRLASTIGQMGADIISAIKAALSGILGSLRSFLHISFEGAGVGGGGFTNASWESGGGSWNGRALPIGAGAGIGHTASQAERAAFIRSYAASIGIDPTTALRVAQSEGFYRFTGDRGTSFGDYQMHIAGGLGDRLLRLGINPADPHNWKQSDKIALDIARREGWGAWHGAARVGIGNHQGIGVRVPPPPPVSKRELTIHNHTHLDGRVVARIVTKHQVAEARMPGSIGPHDTYANYAAAGASMFPA